MRAPAVAAEKITFDDLWQLADRERFAADVWATSFETEMRDKAATASSVDMSMMAINARDRRRRADLYQALQVMIGRIADSDVIKDELRRIAAQERNNAAGVEEGNGDED
jgi:hypothetical protein